MSGPAPTCCRARRHTVFFKKHSMVSLLHWIAGSDAAPHPGMAGQEHTQGRQCVAVVLHRVRNVNMAMLTLLRCRTVDQQLCELQPCQGEQLTPWSDSDSQLVPTLFKGVVHMCLPAVTARPCPG